MIRLNTKYYLKRLKNPGTLIAIASGVILILNSLGVNIESDKILLTVKTFCGIGIALGILNNPDTPGIDIPNTQK
jgi:uncharacterized membrane protein